MTDADLTLRDEVAEVLAGFLATHCPHCLRPMASEADWENTDEGERPDLCWEDSATCGWVSEKEPHERYADALLPLLARVREEGEARVQRALVASRVVCPVHGIPDCSPLLNGCSVPRYIAEWRGEFLDDLRAALAELAEEDA